MDWELPYNLPYNRTNVDCLVCKSVPLKVSKSRKSNMVSSILPKNERWGNFQYIKLPQRSFFGRIQGIIICLRDLLTFSRYEDIRFGRYIIYPIPIKGSSGDYANHIGLSSASFESRQRLCKWQNKLR